MIEAQIIKMIMEEISLRSPENQLTWKGQELLEARVKVLLAEYDLT